jgi:hypothetical protein
MVKIVPTESWTPETLKIELSDDPMTIGYKALLDMKDETYISLCDAVNRVREGEPYAVPRGIISRTTFIGDCLRLGVFDTLAALPDAAAKSGWLFLLEDVMPLIDQFDVNSDTFNTQVARMIDTGLIDRVTADALQYRQGSRAEVLWGPGTVVTPQMMGEVLGPPWNQKL